jgi:Ras-related protein Rab-4B
LFNTIELAFLETSALTGENVEEVFQKCTRSILTKIDAGELDPDRVGSGIQYGNATVSRRPQPGQKVGANQDKCSC